MNDPNKHRTRKIKVEVINRALKYCPECDSTELIPSAEPGGLFCVECELDYDPEAYKPDETE